MSGVWTHREAVGCHYTNLVSSNGQETWSCPLGCHIWSCCTFSSVSSAVALAYAASLQIETMSKQAERWVQCAGASGLLARLVAFLSPPNGHPFRSIGFFFDEETFGAFMHSMWGGWSPPVAAAPLKAASSPQQPAVTLIWRYTKHGRLIYHYRKLTYSSLEKRSGTPACSCSPHPKHGHLIDGTKVAHETPRG